MEVRIPLFQGFTQDKKQLKTREQNKMESLKKQLLQNNNKIKKKDLFKKLLRGLLI